MSHASLEAFSKFFSERIIGHQGHEGILSPVETFNRTCDIPLIGGPFHLFYPERFPEPLLGLQL
jgi:hypothetical protein